MRHKESAQRDTLRLTTCTAVPYNKEQLLYSRMFDLAQQRGFIILMFFRSDNTDQQQEKRSVNAFSVTTLAFVTAVSLILCQLYANMSSDYPQIWRLPSQYQIQHRYHIYTSKMKLRQPRFPQQPDHPGTRPRRAASNIIV